MNQNSVNDRNVTMQEQDFQKHLLRFERTPVSYTHLTLPTTSRV